MNAGAHVVLVAQQRWANAERECGQRKKYYVPHLLAFARHSRSASAADGGRQDHDTTGGTMMSPCPPVSPVTPCELTRSHSGGPDPH